MRQSYLYFAAAALFAVAAGLNLWNEGGVSIKGVAGMTVGTVLLYLGLQMGRQGK